VPLRLPSSAVTRWSLAVTALFGVAALAFFGYAARPAGDAPARMVTSELLRLDGVRPTGPEDGVIRLVAIDASLGSMHGSASFGWRPVADYAAWSKRVGQAAELLRPDVLVVRNVVLDGTRVDGVSFVRTVAPEADLHWQVVFPRLDRRFSGWPSMRPSEWVGRAVVGDVVFSRLPVVDASWTDATDARSGLFAAPRTGTARASLRCGADCTLDVAIGDPHAWAESGTPSEHTAHVVVAPSASADCAVAGDDGHLCLRVSDGVEVLRTVTHARFHDTVVFHSVFAELRLVDVPTP
jgi:hypothetical protein